MATEAEFKAAARRALAAGDTASAQRLIGEAKRLRDATGGDPVGGVSVNKPAAADFAARGGALLDGLANGATLGFGDEALNGLGAAYATATGGDARQTGAAWEQSQRDRNAASGGQFPMEYGGGNIIGGTATSMAAMPEMAASNMATSAAKMAGWGAGEGGLLGLGNSDGVDSLAQTGKGAAIGAGAGLLAVPAVALARTGAEAISGPVVSAVGTATGRASPTRANRVLQRALERSGMSQDDIARALASAKADGQSMFSIADAMGPAGQGAISGVARTPGAGAQEISKFLQSRQASGGERMSQFLADGFDATETAAQRTARLTSERGAAANTAYDAARQGAQPVDVRGALSAIDARTGPMAGSGVAGDGIDGKFLRYRQRLAADQPAGGLLSTELSDFNRVLGVKQDISDDIGAAVRAGRNNEARELTKLRDELDAALETASPDYRAANDNFRNASRTIDAVDTGKDFARGSRRQADTTQAFGSMTPEQQAAARTGYGDSLIAQTENQRSGANRAGPLMTDKRGAEIDAMALNPDTLKRQIGREDVMAETRQRAIGGSRTADNEANIEDVASFDLGMLANIFTGNWKTAGVQAANKAGTAMAGRNEATQALIAKALLSGDADALKAAVAQAAVAQRNNKLLEALARYGAQQQLN